ncbi:MAG TPA: carboxypeptidase-like regulatory domain-containing protein [Candidatus Sulfotelmatobacter sp.]|nr:carboxypeptidase-like regulatory domain-containing protein [Candidatus Sulfotelmatobacter sp.]
MNNLRFVVLTVLELALCLCIAGLFSKPLAAQTTYGSIAGTVSDSSGAAIADAQVTLTNLATTEKRVAQSGSDGLYAFVNLLPSRYSIVAEKTGFKRVTRPELIVEVGQSVRIDVTLQVGDVNQTIEVTSETPLLQAETSSIGQVVEERKATELPLNGRNVFNLITLAPAVVPQGSSGGTPVGVNPFGWGNYQVNGSFGNESAEYLDGQPLNIGYINLPVVIPTQDSIQEFKVQTSNLGADWGKFSGGVINLSTKSGSNGLHGEAYEYLRNKVLDANDFFLNKAGQARPPFTQNQFGANAGGPLIIPHVYNGKDKTFWFFSWEGFRLRTGSAFTTTVPDPKTESNFAGGDFSSLCATGFTGPGGVCADRDKNGNLTDQIFDPCGGTVATAVACPNYKGSPTPFAGNIIPTARLNPTSLALLKFIPPATGTGTPGTIGNNFFTNNFTTATSGGGNQNQVVGRMDQRITDNQHIFFRITYWNVLDLPVDPLGTGLCADRCSEKYESTAPSLGYNWTVTPNTIVGINASLSRFAYNRAPKNSGFDLTTIGWPAQYNAAIPSGARTPPTPCIFNFADNITCSQGQSFITDRNTQWDLSPNVTLVRGRHTVKLGFQLEIGRDNYAQTNVGSGAFAFCGAGLSCFSSFSFADFMLGFADNPSSVENHFFGQAIVPALVAGQQIYRGFYVDDTFRLTNKLTLNLGLRYELQGPWSERFNRQSEFDPTALSWLASPGVSAGLTNVPGLPGLKGDVALVNTSQRTNIPLPKDNVSPRLGFAYSWDAKTVIRGGYGIFWVPNYVSFGLNPNNDFVNDATTSYTGTINGTVPVNTINTPFVPEVVPPVGRTLGALGTSMYATQVVQNFTIADYHDHPAAYIQQWNINIQRNLPWNFFVSAAYVGSKGTHLALYDSQIDQIGDNFLASAATQCAAQVTATGKRCDATGVTLLQSVPNPFFDPTTNTAFALSGPTTTVGQLSRPYPQFTGLKLGGQGDYDSIYHSLQLTVERRFAGAGSLLVAYTNSKLITNADTLTNWLEAATGSIQDFNNLKGERSLSSQDVPQRLVISYVLDLPFGHGKRYISNATGAVDKLVSGWGVDGVTVFQKGFPLVFTNGNPNYTTQFGGGSRPNFVSGCSKGAPSGGLGNKLNEWFNTACFVSPADFTFGNESRTDPTLRGSGVNNFDFALFKRTQFGPDNRLGLEFRTEFFNLFNRTQFAPPNTSVGSANFGVVTSTAAGTNPRLIQFGLKFIF